MKTTVSKYNLIEQSLIENLKSGRYSLGVIPPTEKELMEKFDASRETVRKALDRLALKGFIVRKPGVGTFVNAERENQTVGIIVQQITSYIFPYIVLGAEDYLFRNGYRMLLGNASEDPNKEKQIINEWVESGVNGPIMDPFCDTTRISNTDYAEIWIKEGIKVILVHSNWKIDGKGSAAPMKPIAERGCQDLSTIWTYGGCGLAQIH